MADAALFQKMDPNYTSPSNNIPSKRSSGPVVIDLWEMATDPSSSELDQKKMGLSTAKVVGPEVASFWGPFGSCPQGPDREKRPNSETNSNRNSFNFQGIGQVLGTVARGKVVSSI
jgi:hypothetical protein